MITIKPVDRITGDIVHIARNLRAEDAEEARVLYGQEPEHAVRKSVHGSTETFVAYAGDEPIAVLGAVVTAIEGPAVPWLLGTRGIDTHGAAYIRLGRRYMQDLLRRAPRLHNITLTTSRSSIVLLSRIGFTMGEPYVLSNGAHAQPFYMERV